MNDNPAPETDDLDDLLTAPAGAGDPELRHGLRLRTTCVLRRRRRWRRVGVASALAACFLAGLATWRLWPKPAPAPGATEVAEKPPGPPPVPQPDADLPAVALEWRAADSPDNRADLYRRAGERYVKQDGDLQSALRCYRNALDAGTEEDLTISAGDDWLLMALKDARKKEKNDAKNGS